MGGVVVLLVDLKPRGYLIECCFFREIDRVVNGAFQGKCGGWVTCGDSLGGSISTCGVHKGLVNLSGRQPLGPFLLRLSLCEPPTPLEF